MSNLSDLQDAYTNICAKIKAITASPKPNYSVDGQSVKWADYFEMLTRQAEKIRGLINLEEGPYEEITSLYT